VCEARRPGCAARAADVLDDVDVAVGVVLDPLVAAATEDTRDVLDLQGEVERRLPHASQLPFSAVNRSRFANGSHVEPSKTSSDVVPFDSVVASSVTRCAPSASKLIRVMEPFFCADVPGERAGPPPRPLSWPWNRKCVP
jgi:hypothetical protein